MTFNLRYPGQYYDKESNLHYNYFRSYSAERGRYTQADPIGLEGGFNRFGYVEGNALGFADPRGLRRWKPIFPTYSPPVYFDPDYGPVTLPPPSFSMPDFRVPGFVGGCIRLLSWMFSEDASGEKIPRTVGDLIDESSKDRETKGRSDQYNHEGDGSSATRTLIHWVRLMSEIVAMAQRQERYPMVGR